MKTMNKAEKMKIVIVILSVLLLIMASFCTFFLIKYQTEKRSLKQAEGVISSNNSEHSSFVSENESVQESLRGEIEKQSSAYESKINEQNSIFGKKEKEYEGQINELKKQLALKNDGKNDKVEPLPLPPMQSGQTVYLTFDDGPSAYTPKFLDILDQYGVKGTFFVINSRYKSTMKDIVNRGHAIGLHTATHNYAQLYSSDEAYYNDLNTISSVVKEQTGVDTKLIRFPGGGSNTISKKYCSGIMSRITKGVEEKGYVYYDWNCSSGDAEPGRKTVENIMKNIKKYPKSAKNIIVLMHDSQAITLQALPQIIEYYKSCGMSFGVLTTDVPPVHHRVNN